MGINKGTTDDGDITAAMEQRHLVSRAAATTGPGGSRQIGRALRNRNLFTTK